MAEETQTIEKKEESKPKVIGIPFVKGDPRICRTGRTKMTEEEKIKSRAIKEYVKEYKQKLAEALPEISPVLIRKATEGDISAIKEVNDRVIGKAQNNVDLTTNGESLNKVLVEFIDGEETEDNQTSAQQREEISES